MIDASKFIETYEKYYFKKDCDQIKRDSAERDTLGIKGIRTTLKEDEEFIVDRLTNGKHDKYVIAWKLGSFHVADKDKIDAENIVGYRTYNVSVYLDKIDQEKDEIIKLIEAALECFWKNNQLDAVRELSEAFGIIKECCKGVEGFGTVYMINSMFFLSKGKIPIYDKNVFKAVQALYLKKNPKDITVSGAPDAKDSMGAMFRLIEYMYLLDNIFGDKKTEPSKDDHYRNYENDGYISRGLDRALWVYGQCTKKYEEDSSKSVI